MICLTAAKDEFAEILVVCNEDSFFSCGAGNDIPIVGLRHRLGNGQYIVAGGAQGFDDRHTSGLIDEKFHGGWVLGGNGEGENVFVSQHLGCICKSSADVLGLQTWVFPQDLRLRNPLSQHAHNELYRDASPTDDWLTNHDFGVHGNTLSMLFIHGSLLPPGKKSLDNSEYMRRLKCCKETFRYSAQRIPLPPFALSLVEG